MQVDLKVGITFIGLIKEVTFVSSWHLNKLQNKGQRLKGSYATPVLF